MKRLMFLVSLLACGRARTAPSATFAAYAEGRLTAIASGLPASISVSAAHASCVQVGSCFAPTTDADYCATPAGPADLLMVSGALKHTFCYPSSSSQIIVVATATDLVISQTGAVVTFNSGTYNQWFGGKLDIEADNVVIYGNGPQSTLFRGNLEVHGANAKIRGVRIGGAVVTQKPIALAFTTIAESAELPAGSAVIATLVLGSLTLSGGLVAQSEVQGTFNVTASECESNRHVADISGDGLIDQNELGSAIDCGN